MTDWMPYSQAGSLSTLQCVTTWRGSEAGTYPLNVLWAGTDGTLWQSTTDPHSEFAQMFTDADTVVTHMAVDDRGTIYGINSSGKPVQYGNDAWISLDLGDNSEQYVMVDVAVATKDDTVWFVAREGQYYVHGTNITMTDPARCPKSGCSDESPGLFRLEFGRRGLGCNRMGRAGIQRRQRLGVQNRQYLHDE